MNTVMNTTAIHRRIASGVVAVIAASAFTACGAEVSPPSQDIGQDRAQKDRTGPSPKRTTGNRYDFNDEYGTAKIRVRKARPAGSGTHNRMDFGDDGQ